MRNVTGAVEVWRGKVSPPRVIGGKGSVLIDQENISGRELMTEKKSRTMGLASTHSVCTEWGTNGSTG